MCCDLCRWIQSWATLVIAASSYEAVKPRLILDLIDYPDRAGLEWQSQDNGQPGAGQYVFAVNSQRQAMVTVVCVT